MEKKGSFFILLFIVAVLTLAITILAAYLFFVSGSTPKAGTETIKQETTKIPNENDLGTYNLFSDKKPMNLKSIDDTRISVIAVNVEIVYFLKVEGIKEVEKKIVSYEGEIKEIVYKYFLNLTIDDVKKPELIEQAKKDLREKINDLVNSGEKEKKNIIYKVVFSDWFFQG